MASPAITLIGLLNTAYAYFGARQWHITAFVLSILLSAAVTAIYYIARTNHSGGGIAEELFVHLPFSLYHAWALCLVIFSGYVELCMTHTLSPPPLLFFHFH